MFFERTAVGDQVFIKQAPADVSRRDDLLRIMRPIRSPPILYSRNGCGTALYGELRYPHIAPYYIAIRFITLGCIPLLPAGCYLVKDGADDVYHFLGKLRYRDLIEYAGPQGMRAFGKSLLQHPSVWVLLVWLSMVILIVVVGSLLQLADAMN